MTSFVSALMCGMGVMSFIGWFVLAGIIVIGTDKPPQACLPCVCGMATSIMIIIPSGVILRQSLSEQMD